MSYPRIESETDSELIFARCACGAEAMTEIRGVGMCGPCACEAMNEDTPPEAMTIIPTMQEAPNGL